MIIRAIQRCFEKAEKREWGWTCWGFDIHATILRPNFKVGEITTEFYPYARDVLREISGRTDIIMILFTCSWPYEQEQYLEFFGNNGIYFKYVNENPDVRTRGYGYYEQKFYLDVLFEDKAGFDPETEWLLVQEEMKKHR